MEIPTRYSVLLIVLGIGMITAPYYFIGLGKSPINLFILTIAGGTLLFFGLSYLKYEYDIEMDIKESEHIKLKYESIKYFDKNKLLTSRNKEKMIKNLKDILNKK
jgi:membrane-bound ClpP family serine protease